MGSKRQARTVDIKNKKKKKGAKILILSLIVSCVLGFLVFFFLTLFDSVYPPVAGKGGKEKSREKQQVTLYFSDTNERFLFPEKRYIPKENNREGQAKEIIKALVEGSKTGLVSTFPVKTDIISVKIESNQTAQVSFGQNLAANHPGGSASEMATIYSLTNTLIANIPEIKKVKILIEGKEQESIKGHIDIRNPFTFNKELIAPTPTEG
ncbi:MAG: GerMN domain-containing protein [Syntrophales bacterium]|nr:GerMN domain-containing protein [Syntrophales bacterium]